MKFMEVKTQSYKRKQTYKIHNYRCDIVLLVGDVLTLNHYRLIYILYILNEYIKEYIYLNLSF